MHIKKQCREKGVESQLHRMNAVEIQGAEIPTRLEISD